MGRTTAFGAAAAAAVVVVVGVLLAVANCQNGNMAALELDNATRVYWGDLTGPGASVLNNTYLAGKGHYGPQGTPLMVGLSLIQGAAEIGALCLDGTLPGYHLDKGWGTGADSWLIQLEGGGWCNDLRTCSYRKTSRHGSSRYMERAILFSGILSNKRSENPDFYNWNRVKLRYCDGASFTGDVEGGNEVPRLFFRGQRIWQAGMADLLAQGMNRAKQALLSGCSAGGLAAILHCDEFRELMPQRTKVKCLSDAGMFLDVPDVSGGHTLRAMFHSLVKMQGVAKSLPKSCTSRRDPAQCFFPQYMLQTIKTPLFLLNTAYDSWQVMSSLAPNSADPHGRWRNCKLNPANCNPNQMQKLQGFRMQMLRAVRGFMNSPGKGLFINSCFAHCQTERQDTWFAPNSPRLTKSVAESVGDWYFDRRPVKEVDCAYPCDSSCHNLIFRSD